MVKLIIGKKGTGKTKQLLDSVNQAVQTDGGHLVFINSGTRHMFDIDHNVRLVNTEPFGIKTYCALYGFICGIISEDYDISNIFIDGVCKIVTKDAQENFETFLTDLEKISLDYSVEFTITMSIAAEDAPEFAKAYV